MSKDYLESAILDLWKSHADIGSIYEYACESPREEFDQEVTANVLLGQLEMMNIRLNKLYRIFDEMESDGQFN